MLINIERMGESALKSHIKGDEDKGNTYTTQSALVGTFLHKEITSSWGDIRSESGSSRANDSIECFS